MSEKDRQETENFIDREEQEIIESLERAESVLHKYVSGRLTERATAAK